MEPGEINNIPPSYEEPGPIGEKGHQNTQETDEFISPLMSEPVKNKEYTKTHVKATANQLSDDIPEPQIKPKVVDLTQPRGGEFDDDSNSSGPGNTQQGAQQSQQKEQEPFNHRMSSLKPKDKRKAAERAADAVLDGYAFLKQQGNYFLKISERKINKLEKEKKVDFTIPVPYDRNNPDQTITLREYMRIFNDQNGSKLYLSEETRADIYPVLVQLFEEKGIGMTPQDELIYLGIKELFVTGVQFYRGLQVKQDMINSIVELTKEYRSAGHGGGQSTYTPPPPPPPPPPTGGNFNNDVEKDDPNAGHENGHDDNRGGISEAIVVHEPPDLKNNPGLQSANDLALNMIGAETIQPQANKGTVIVKKAGGGRPDKETAAKLKQDRIDKKTK